MAPLLIDHGCRSSWRVTLLRQATFSNKVNHLPAVEAWKVELWLLLLELPRLELWVMAPNSAVVVVNAADPQVWYTPCGT
jgi:hypothetical protein